MVEKIMEFRWNIMWQAYENQSRCHIRMNYGSATAYLADRLHYPDKRYFMQEQIESRILQPGDISSIVHNL